MLENLALEINKCISDDKTNIRVGGDALFLQEFINNMIDIKEKPPDYQLKIFTPEEHKEVVLVSGGLDSTITYFLRKKENENVLPLFIDIGASYNAKELMALHDLGIVFRLRTMLLTGKWEHIIPGRNLTLLAIASSHVENQGTIWLSSVSGETPDRGGDKSFLFYRHVEKLILFYTGKIIYIKTLGDKTKADWIKHFVLNGPGTVVENEIILKKTISCFSGIEDHCGCCRACVRKWIAFEYNKINIMDCFDTHPAIGGAEFIIEYIAKMEKAIKEEDFSYYTKDRCLQTLSVIRN